MWGLRKMVFKRTHRVTLCKEVTNVAFAKMREPGGRVDVGVRVSGVRHWSAACLVSAAWRDLKSAAGYVSL